MFYRILQFSLILFFILNSAFSTAFANSDSLLLVIKTQSDGPDKIRNLLKLGKTYRMKDRDSSLLFYEHAQLLSQKSDDAKGMTIAATAIGKIYELNGEIENAKKYYKSALATASEKGLPKSVPGIYLEMSMLYRMAGQSDSAFLCVANADRAFDKIGEEYQKWKIHSLIGHLHKDRKEYDKAGEAFEKALEIVEKGDNRIDKGYLLYSTGLNFFEAENFEKFAVYSQKWQDFNRKPGTQNFIAESPNHSGTLFLFSPDDPANIDRMRKAVAYQKSVKDYMRTGLHERSLGLMLFRQGKEKEALKVWHDSEKSLRKANSRVDLVVVYARLYKTYKEQKDLPAALAYLEKYQMLSDSIKEEELMKNFDELETKYETDKKEKEIALLNSENQVKELELEKAERRNILIIIGLLVALFIAGLLFYFYRQKQKDNAVISKALKEKELLLREIHHRVKNNLQVISSLLSLQSRFIEDENALEAIKEGRDRVKSMALIHQNLYQEDNLTGIKVQAYFEKLINSLFNSYNISPERIKLETEIQNINLDVDTVIPLGLIVNELVSNALKHAFPGNRDGIIKVLLTEENTGLKLRVSDNGIGWKKEINLEQSDSFGFRMINAFRNRLEAQLDIENNNGAQITMLIKEYEKVA